MCYVVDARAGSACSRGSSRPRDLSTIADVSFDFNDCEEGQEEGDGRCPTDDELRYKHVEELEKKFEKGWEMWVSQMGGDAQDTCTYNFDAEELAVRLGTHIDKASKLHAKIMLQKIYHFWHCKVHTDMILLAENAREEVHFHMLAAHTEFFEKVVLVSRWEKLWREGKLVLDLSGMVTPRALRTIITFAYTGAVKLTLDNATDIAMGAKNLGFRRLQQHCMEFLDYVFADFHLFIILRNVPVDHKFFDVAWTKILKRFRFISHDTNFLTMDPMHLELLIASDKLNIESEYEAFKPVLNWINHDRGNREKYFFKLMGQVRFAYMELDELISCMQEDDLFRRHPDAQKMLEDADMYATMESMGDQWCNYPPWPPRNEIIKRKVYTRGEKLKELRPKSKNDICNAGLPCALQTNYGAKFDKTCPNTECRTCEVYCTDRGFGRLLPLSCTPTGDAARERAKSPAQKRQEKCCQQAKPKKVLMDGNEACTNRTAMLDQMRTLKAQDKIAVLCAKYQEENNYSPRSLSPGKKGPSASASAAISEISLPSCMVTPRKRL
ncbi:kelch repeat and BTB domain-containing protein 3-like [Paramacrobiotus metropolitanus]|uniref:kelch repeat and BTB domain-containing protein 3-like n=1 Tax=Paramacrobiotus metropolitanus TaxID=2943436 RepID=UPI002445C5A6|nr:kelch repeat and BTB domain-containing protein 3-like [Paramacrobiotus metropolitanus]